MPTALSDRRMLLPWYAAEITNSYATTLLTYCSYFLAERLLGTDTSARLWLSAAWGVSYIFFSLLAGRMTDRWGPRVLMVRSAGGSVFTASLGTLAIYERSYWLLLLALIAYNFTCTQMWPALETAISRTPAKLSLSHRMTIYNVTWSIGNFAAMFSADAVMHVSPYAAYLVPALFSLLAMLIVALTAIGSSQLSARATHSDVEDAHAPPYAPRLLLMAWIANAMGYVAINTLIPAMPTITQQVAHGYALAGSLWSFARVVGFVTFAAWIGWHYRRRYLVAALALMTVTFAALLTMPTVPVFIIAQIAFGMMTAFVYASSLYYAMHVSHGSGGHAGIHEALIGLGIAVGPTVGAIMGTGADSLPRVAAGVTIILLLGVAGLVVLSRRNPQPEALQSTA